MAAAHPPLQPPYVRPTGRFMLSHPAHALALGLGSGLSPKAAGTVGTLWAWAAYLVLQPWMNEARWGLLLLVGLPLAWWACSVTARHLRAGDPGCIVIDEILAFWLVLWLITPADWAEQLLAFGLFRYFDAAKPGPVGWADRRFKLHQAGPIGWAQGFGILFDDLVAAACTLAVLMIARWPWT